MINPELQLGPMQRFLFAVACYAAGMSSLIFMFWQMQFGFQDHASFSWIFPIWNAFLFLIFPIQHSLLARPSIKVKIQQILPPLLERPCYVGTSGIAMWIVLLLWKPFGPELYRFQMALPFDLIFGLSLLLIVISTIKLDHSAMFGLKQGYAAWKGMELPAAGLQTKGIYNVVRHPITSLFIVTLWSHESMTASKLLFNMLFTAYAIAGTILEELDLKKHYRQEYAEYCKRVPAFIPRLW